MLLGQAYDLFIADRKINGCTPKALALYHDSAGAFVRSAATTATDAAVTSLADYVTPFSLSLQEDTYRTRLVTRIGAACVLSCAFSVQKAIADSRGFVEWVRGHAYGDSKRFGDSLDRT